jgi:hypothetical protein
MWARSKLSIDVPPHGHPPGLLQHHPLDFRDSSRGPYRLQQHDWGSITAHLAVLVVGVGTYAVASPDEICRVRQMSGRRDCVCHCRLARQVVSDFVGPIRQGLGQRQQSDGGRGRDGRPPAWQLPHPDCHGDRRVRDPRQGAVLTTATESPNTPRIVGVATNYLELVAGFRARLAELGISYSTLDEIAGWTDSYATKVLGEEPLRHMGAMALDAMLGATGLKIALIDDPERLARVKNHRHFVRRKHRARAVATRAYVAHRVTLPFLREIGSTGGHARREKLSSRRREQIARKAARAKAAKPSPQERSASASKAAKARWRTRSPAS